MKLSSWNTPRAVWGAPGDPSSPERWAMAWKVYKGPNGPTWKGVGGTLIVCGLNPSTAWAQDGLGELDPTLTRIHSFALGLGVSDVCMVNLYPQRHTDPKDLWGSIRWSFDAVGSTVKACKAIASLGLPEPFIVVAAWGSTQPPSGCFRPGVSGMCWDKEEHRMHVQHAALYLQALGGGQLWCWGTTKAGHPRHPLYLPATAQLQPWRAP